MPKNQKGFSTLLILIMMIGGLLVLAGGVYLLQKNNAFQPGVPTSPVSSAEPQPTVSSDIIPAPNPSPLPNPSPGPMVITSVTQPQCTSTSCTSTTILVIVGSGFSNRLELAATGQTNGNPYIGTLSGLNNDGTQVIFDLLNIPCQTYTATLTNPMPTGGSATFTFFPKKCT